MTSRSDKQGKIYYRVNLSACGASACPTKNANPVSGIGVLISDSGKTHADRHLVPRPAFQRAPGPFLLDSAPLLEKERDPRPQALIADFGHPGRLERTRAGAGFAVLSHANHHNLTYNFLITHSRWGHPHDRP